MNDREKEIREKWDAPYTRECNCDPIKGYICDKHFILSTIDALRAENAVMRKAIEPNFFSCHSISL